ncbi:MAG: PP2C family protein-serine/threonine phosphatase [Bacillota bacterium]
MLKRSFSIGALTDVGNVKKINQDNILVRIGDGSLGEFGLFVVADGMGGLAAGETASRMIVNGFSSWWDNKLSSMLNTDENLNIGIVNKELDTLIRAINSDIIDFGLSINDKVGSTLSMLFIYGSTYLIKHIGDSRVYLINSSMTKLTEDHSWVALQVREGKMTPEEARNHPKRNILTRCIGVTHDIEIFETGGEIRPEDSFVLCSDGFYNYLDENEIHEGIISGKEDDDNVQEYLVHLLEKVKLRGAHDNVSVIAVCQCLHEEPVRFFGLKGIIKRIINFGRR